MLFHIRAREYHRPLTYDERHEKNRRDRILQLQLAIAKAERSAYKQNVQLQIRVMKTELKTLLLSVKD